MARLRTSPRPRHAEPRRAGARLHSGRPGLARRRAGPGPHGDPGGSRRPSSPALAAAHPSGVPGTSPRPWPWPSSCSRSPSGCSPSNRRRSSPLAIPVVGVAGAPRPGGPRPADARRDGPGRRRRGRRRGCRAPRPWPSRRDAGGRRARDGADDDTIAVDGTFDIAEAEARFVRRQRRDALGPSASRGSGPVPAARRPATRARRTHRGRAGAARDPPAEPAWTWSSRRTGRSARRRNARPSASTRSPRTSRARAPGRVIPRTRPGGGAADARRAAPRQPRRPGHEPRPAGLRRGRRPVAARPRQRAEGRRRIAALSRALSRTVHGEPAGQPGGRSEEGRRGPRGPRRQGRRHDPGRA